MLLGFFLLVYKLRRYMKKIFKIEDVIEWKMFRDIRKNERENVHVREGEKERQTQRHR